MDSKSLTLLEFDKVLQQLALHTAFAASRALALHLLPSADLRIVRQLQAQTSEARLLLAEKPDLRVGGARDVRAAVGLAARGGTLQPDELLDVKSTLVAGREQQRIFARQAQLYPALADIVGRIPEIPGLD
jgi:DNA mismatch repair protein MutS2